MPESRGGAAKHLSPGAGLKRIRPSDVALGLVAAGAAACVWIWVRAAVQMASHGFDVSDEGGYLLAYRWWSVNHRTYTGHQYLYGPVFQFLGYDIARLRLFRLFTIVAAHVLFGAAFMQWLRLRRPRAPQSSLWEIAGTAAIVAASGMVCAWLPLSPGYNDPSLLGAVLAAAFALRLATHVERGSPIPGWLPACFGVLIVPMMLAKWASAVATLGPVVAVAAIVVSARGGREVGRVAAWTVAGAAAFLALFNVFIVRLDAVLPEILAVNRLILRTSNAPATLLPWYWNTGVALLAQTIERHALLLTAAVVAVVSRGRVAQTLAAVLAIAGVYGSIADVHARGGLAGGTDHLSEYAVTIHAIALAALALGVTAVLFTRSSRAPAPALGRETLRGWLMLGLVGVLPVTQGIGTGNALYAMVVNGFAMWMAIIVAIATGIDTAPRVGRWLAGAIGAGAVASAALIAKSGLTEHPYRTDGLAQSNAVARGVPALRSIALRADVARQFSELHGVLEPYIVPAGRAMMGFDEIPGILLALDGRVVGEAWASASDVARTAEGLRASCRDGKPWWGSRWPILLFRREVTGTEIAALRDCGIDFATDYRLVAPPRQTMNLSVYVPAGEASSIRARGGTCRSAKRTTPVVRIDLRQGTTSTPLRRCALSPP
jgi:hypothetical protein